ncbi:hypothetical protein CERZMDRAFT_91468 [Cercospora zeae-maydis SCOH1-5]|uniref:Uncharacterized protein n=1 Tax=Cercospora zeae-maydis SCOH1-5 TaxID=717836 RepID=A0A6A6F6F7_9PEZI|nr:hypothetical protein CERZMDRAFT_91468 [Cercospora zeae-maydis SCOH1-5]
MSANRGRPVMMPVQTTGAFWLEPAHIGDPCTISCLDHMLSCGHKIITAYPEPCARNCHTRSPPDLLQPRDIGETFRCTACIIEHIAQRRRARSQSYKTELLDAAAHTYKDEAWIAAKLDLVSVAWKDEDVEEFQSLSSRSGRNCMAPWIDPEFEDVVEIASGERSSFSPSPSSRSSTTLSHRRNASSRSNATTRTLSSSGDMMGIMSSPPSPTPTIGSVESKRSISSWSTSAAAAFVPSPYRI